MYLCVYDRCLLFCLCSFSWRPFNLCSRICVFSPSVPFTEDFPSHYYLPSFNSPIYSLSSVSSIFFFQFSCGTHKSDPAGGKAWDSVLWSLVCCATLDSQELPCLGHPVCCKLLRFLCPYVHFIVISFLPRSSTCFLSLTFHLL